MVLRLNLDGIVLMTGGELQHHAGIKMVITASSLSRSQMPLITFLLGHTTLLQ